MSYLTQIRLLSEASSKIQDAVNECIDDVARGKMYATQDLISDQVRVLMAQEDEKNRKEREGHTEYDFLAN